MVTFYLINGEKGGNGHKFGSSADIKCWKTNTNVYILSSERGLGKMFNLLLKLRN